MRTSRALVLSFVVPGGLAWGGTSVYIESSVNGGPYVQHLVVTPGQRVTTRVRLDTEMTQSVGLAGMSFKIDALNLVNERVLPFSLPNTSAGPEGPGVGRVGGLGRVAPFASAAATTIPQVTYSASGATISGAGTGDVIACFQGSPALSGTKFDRSLSPVIFRFAFNAGVGGAEPRTISLQVHSIFNGAARWYTELGSTSGNALNNDVLSNFGGSVTVVVPSPGVGAAFVVGCVLGVRRRRGG